MDTKEKCRHAYISWQMAENRKMNWSHQDCLDKRHEYTALQRAYRDNHQREWHEEMRE